MATSLHSSKPNSGKDLDPELLVKVGIFNAPVVVVITDAPENNDCDASEYSSSPWEVTLEKSEDPKTMATWYKWAIVLTTSCGAMCVNSASSMVSAARHILHSQI